jgi:hypothetical protein
MHPKTWLSGLLVRRDHDRRHIKGQSMRFLAQSSVQLACAALLTATPGLAQQPWAPQVKTGDPGSVPVLVRVTEPGPAYDIYRERIVPGADSPLESCRNGCDITLPPGRYQVRVRGRSEKARHFTIAEPSRLVVEPPSESDRSFGLALGIVGGALLALGSAFVIAASTSTNDCAGALDCAEKGGRMAGMGLAFFAVGAVATPLGWVTYAHSFSPAVRVDPLATTARRSTIRTVSRAPAFTGAMFRF